MVQAQGDQSAQVQRGRAVMQPVIVLDHAAVSEATVAAGQPGDGTFNHRTVLAVLVLPGGISRVRPCRALELVVDADGEFPTVRSGRTTRRQST